MKSQYVSIAAVFGFEEQFLNLPGVSKYSEESTVAYPGRAVKSDCKICFGGVKIEFELIKQVPCI